MTTKVFTTPVPEGSTRVYKARLVGEDGITPIADIGSITAITLLELRDVASGQIVNSRQNVNAMPGLTPDAWLWFVFNALDNAAIGTAKKQERRATWRVQYTDGQEHHQVTYYVENLSGVS